MCLSHNPCFSGILFAIKVWKRKIDYKRSQSLFQWNTLCNGKCIFFITNGIKSQSLFQWNTLCNFIRLMLDAGYSTSQSLFQWNTLCNKIISVVNVNSLCHNPCFSGILFAIRKRKTNPNRHIVTILVLVEYSLQY